VTGHEPVYRRCGFSRLVSESWEEASGDRWVGLVGAGSAVPARVLRRLRPLADQFHGYGSIRWSLVAIVYVAPLAGALDRLLTSRALLAMAFGVVIMLSQPALAAGRRASPADRGSILGITLAAVVGQMTGALEYGYASHRIDSEPLILLGLVLMVGGLAVRLVAIRTLGAFFTADVRITTGQQLLTSGIYRRLRHPSYTGAWVGFVGACLVLGAPFGVALTAIGLLAAYVYRIRVEEAALVAAFGDEYRSYRMRSRRLIPAVW
jgi:protein-S-isoprenylcysteine O-methyltransferase